MMTPTILLPVLVMLGRCGAPPEVPLHAVPFTAVQLRGPFWDPRLRALRDGTLEANLEQCERTGRLRNFDRAAGKLDGEFEGLLFNDSDVYKALEGACYVLSGIKDDEDRALLDARLDALIERIVAAQQPDGYINTYYTVKQGLANRWTREQWNHETYCIGHLIEAGIAHAMATGKHRLLDSAIRAADHVAGVFHEGGLTEPSGHEEIELALMRLADFTGQNKYRNLALFFVDQRGRPHRALDGAVSDPWGDYCQDHVPFREQMEAAGHAVRAGYLYAAATDIAAWNGDPGLSRALDSLWTDITQRRIYVTGGIGPSAHNEGFTDAFDLPNQTAYQETCASIAMAMWAQRMGLLHGDARYLDAFESALYNGILAGVSLDGRRFFYVNPLASRGDHRRQDWFACACCPPNILQFLGGAGGAAYATAPGTVFVNLYADSDARVPLDGAECRIRQRTRYPWDGKVRLTVEPPQGKPVRLALRRPGWARSFVLEINGKTVRSPRLERDYLHVDLPARSSSVTIEFPMPVERIYADPRVKADLGRVALRRGPIVYAFETGSLTALASVTIPGDAAFSAHHDEWGGGENRPEYVSIRTKGIRWLAGPDGLYSAPRRQETVPLTAIPYFMWGNRGPTSMSVWMPESPQFLDPAPQPGVVPESSSCCSGDSVLAVCDRLEPSSSGDHSVPRLTWWDHKGGEEWLALRFDEPRTVGGVEAYWFDDRAVGGGCRVPVSWSVEFFDGEQWRQVWHPSAAACEPDRFNECRFHPVSTRAVRIRVRLQDGFSGGLLEVRAEP